MRDLARPSGISSTSRPGLPMVSPITRRVLGRIADAEFVERARLDESRGDAEARQRVGQQIDGAAIKRGRGDDVVAGIEQRRDRQMQRGHPARRADRADAALKRGKPLLEHRRGRIRNPGVDVSGALEIEQRRGVVGILEHVGRGLIDRDRTRARDRIRMLAGMKAQGLERGRLGCGHVELERRRGLPEIPDCSSICHKNCSIVSPAGSRRFCLSAAVTTAKRACAGSTAPGRGGLFSGRGLKALPCLARQAPERSSCGGPQKFLQIIFAGVAVS